MFTTSITSDDFATFFISARYSVLTLEKKTIYLLDEGRTSHTLLLQKNLCILTFGTSESQQVRDAEYLHFHWRYRPGTPIVFVRQSIHQTGHWFDSTYLPTTKLLPQIPNEKIDELTMNGLFRCFVFPYKYEYVWSRKNYLVVWREFHGGHRIDVLLHFVEEIIPSTNQFAFLLVVDQLQNVTTPYLTDLVINILKTIL